MRWLLGARLFLARVFLPRTLRGSESETPAVNDVVLCLEASQVYSPGVDSACVYQDGIVASCVYSPGIDATQVGCC